ncbi:MAG: hypothetical protein R6V06_03070 [Kiritimatiellia bacterium]
MSKNIHDMSVGSDPELSAMEKETTLTFPNDTDTGRIHTEVPTVIKWVLSVSESEVENHRSVDGEIVAVTATIPKGIIKLQGSARKHDTHSQMVSYGDER